MFVFGLTKCMSVKPDTDMNSVCPKLGDRYESTFGTMIATTLALLTGGAIATTVKPKTKPKPPVTPPPGRQ